MRAKTNTNEKGTPAVTETVNPYSTAPTTNINDPIAYTPKDLQSSDTPIDIPDVPQDTTYAGAEGDFTSLAEQNQAYIDLLTKQSAQAGKAAGSSFDQYISGLEEGKDVETLTFEAEQEVGLPELEGEVNRLNAELMREQRALKNRVDLLNANVGGGLASGVAGEIANAQRESYSKQADIAVVQMAAQGRFDSAQQWAQRKAAIQFAEKERVIDIREKIYNANKEYFDKLDNRAFSAKTDDMKRLLEQERADFEVLQGTKLDALKMAQMNGAPVAILQAIQSATTPEGVLQAGGQYAVTDLLQRQVLTAQLNKIGMENAIAAASAADRANGILTDDDINNIDNSPQGKKLQVAADLKLKMNTYQQLVEKHGLEMFGTDKAKLENAYKELQLSYKEAANLGVLNGPDLTIIEDAIKSATPGMFGHLGNVLSLGQGTRNLKANLEQAQQTLNTTAQANAQQLYARDSAYQNSEYIKTMLLPFGDELATTDELVEMDEILFGIPDNTQQP